MDQGGRTEIEKMSSSWYRYEHLISQKLQSYPLIRTHYNNHPLIIIFHYFEAFLYPVNLRKRRTTFSRSYAWNSLLFFAKKILHSLHESGPRSTRWWNFEMLGVIHVVDFWWLISINFSQEKSIYIGNEKSAQSFSDRIFSWTSAWDVRSEMLTVGASSPNYSSLFTLLPVRSESDFLAVSFFWGGAIWWRVAGQGVSYLETGIGGVKSPKIRGGVKILSISGAPEIDPFLQRFYRKSPI